MATATERKLVTVLFCDLVGSTQLGEQLDAEALHELKRTYFARVESLIGAHRGVVEKFIGDAVVAIFGIPIVREGDAERAVLCALDITNASEELSTTLRQKFGVGISVRIGVNTGEVMVGSTTAGEVIATGDTMNIAARLQQSADPGSILVGRDTMLLSKDSIEYSGSKHVVVKGKGKPIEVWSPIGPGSTQSRSKVRLVGRDEEIGQLDAAVNRSLVDREPSVVLVFGEPGIGKSRLAGELETRVSGKVAVYRGACLPYGEGTVWAPLREVITAEVGVSDSDPERVRQELVRRLASRHTHEEAALIGSQFEALIGTSRREVAGAELLWALRRYIEAAATETPAVIVLDDLHWATETLLETLQELIETMPPVPLTLLLLGRAELKLRLSPLAASHDVTVINLDGLEPGPARELASQVAAQHGIHWTEDLEESVLERAGGNPLFVEELSAMATAENTLSGLPHSLSALLAARLDALPSAPRKVAQIAGVVGEVFWDAALSELDGEAHRSISGAVRTLRTEGVIREEPHSILVGCRQFRFRHALMRETAYNSLSKQRRSEMHKRLATWFEERATHRPELCRVVAHHFDRAVTLRAEVTPFASPDDELLEMTVDSLIQAGRWATDSAALSDALALFRRGVDLGQGSSKRDLALSELAAAMATAGKLAQAERIAGEVIQHDSQPEAAAVAHLALARVAQARGDDKGIDKHCLEGLRLARAASLPSVEALLLEVFAWSDFWAGRINEAAEKWEQAGAKGLEVGNLALLAAASAQRALLQAFMLDVPAADQMATQALRMATESGSMRALATAHCAMARVCELQDDLEEALRHGTEWVRFAEETGETLEEIAGRVFGVAEPLIALERPREASHHLSVAEALSDQAGGTAYDGNVHYNSARALLMIGDIDGATRHVDRLEQSMDSRYWDTGVDWAKASSMLAEARGVPDNRSEQVLRSSLASTSGGVAGVWPEVEALLQLARILIRRQAFAEAKDALDRIRSLVEGRGATRLLRRLRSLESRLDDS